MDPSTPSSDLELPTTVELPSRAVHVGRDWTGCTSDDRSLAALLFEPRIPQEARR